MCGSGIHRRAVSIDDTRTSQMIVSHALAQVGFDTRLADDGFRGWQLVEEYHPDLVVTDLDMPNWGGWQLIEAIRNTPNPKVESVPIIVCSATDDPLSIREAFDAGASYFLPKPIEVPELVSLLRWLLDKKYVCNGSVHTDCMCADAEHNRIGTKL